MPSPNTVDLPDIHLFVVIEQRDNEMKVAAIYDDREQAERRTAQIAKRRCNDLTASVAKEDSQESTSTVSFKVENSSETPAGVLQSFDLLKETTSVTPAGYFSAEKTDVVKEKYGRFLLLDGCNRCRLHSTEALTRQLIEQSAVAESERAAQVQVHCDQIENLRTRLVSLQQSYANAVEDNQRLRRLADEYQRDHLEAKTENQRLQHSMLGLKQDITNVRNIDTIYASEIERLREEIEHLKQLSLKQKQRNLQQKKRLDAARTELHDARYLLQQNGEAEVNRSAKRTRSVASDTDFQNDAGFSNMLEELKSVLAQTGKIF